MLLPQACGTTGCRLACALLCNSLREERVGSLLFLDPSGAARWLCSHGAELAALGTSHCWDRAAQRRGIFARITRCTDGCTAGWRAAGLRPLLSARCLARCTARK